MATGYVPPVGGQPAVATSVPQEPIATIGGVPGSPSTRVSAIAGTTLTIQNWNGAAWVAGVPTWLRNAGAQLATAPVVAGPPAFNGNLTCTGVAVNQLLGCDTAAAGPTRHPAYTAAAPQPITLRRENNATVVINTVGASAANSAIINVNLSAANIATYFPTLSRVIFVGEDPVTCTGFSKQPVVIGAAADALTGCTFPATPGAALAVNDPVYTGSTSNANLPILNGFIKIEQQTNAGAWNDVTQEILRLGFSWRNQQGAACGTPHRLRSSASSASATTG